jgi:hypothetical protein
MFAPGGIYETVWVALLARMKTRSNAVSTNKRGENQIVVYSYNTLQM